MGLKAPGILTFLLTVILTVIVLVTKFFDANVPIVKDYDFWVLLTAHVVLILACLMRGL